MGTYTARDLWRHILGDGSGYLCVASGQRAAPGAALADWEERFFAYPAVAGFAEGLVEQADRRGRDAYFCAHLLTDKRRKGNAAAIRALYYEMDGGALPAHLPRPTALVESSPGHHHGYYRLTRALPPAEAAALNKRLTYALGADPSGWDLGQMLRPPGTTNHKYAGAPPVRVLYIEDRALDPDELDRLLPPAPQDAAPPPANASTPTDTTGDEPPVRLDADGLAWWTGARVARKDGGDETDRSETLFGLGYELARANASPALIAAAVAERDVALGLRCYADRPDAERRYRAIAWKALNRYLQNVEAHGGGDCGARLAELERELAEERRRREQVETALAATRDDLARTREQFAESRRECALLEKFITHPEQALVGGAFGLGAELAAAKAHGHTLVAPHPETGEPVEFRRCYITGAAAKARCSPDKVARVRDRCVKSGKLVALPTPRKEKVCTIDPQTGQEREITVDINYYHTPGQAAGKLAIIDHLLTTPREKDAQGREKKHGGKRTPRPACPEHPNAGTYEATTTITTTRCQACHSQLAEAVEPAAPAFFDADGNRLPGPPPAPPSVPQDAAPLSKGTVPQDAAWEQEPLADAAPQDAAWAPPGPGACRCGRPALPGKHHCAEHHPDRWNNYAALRDYTPRGAPAAGVAD